MNRLKVGSGLGMAAIALVAAAGLVAQAPSDIPSTPIEGVGAAAKAVLAGLDPRFKGKVTFTQTAEGVRIVADVSGTKPGKHGLQIYSGGVCVAPFTSAGMPFNLYNLPHGCPPSPHRQLGDLGNVEIRADGNGHFDKVVDKISLAEPHHQIIGRSIVLHSGEDDCKTSPSGGSGEPIACGVIVR